MKKVLLLLALMPFITKAQVSVWDGDSDGDGDGLKWGDPLNWVADKLPQKEDLVQIAADSVLVSEETVIGRLEMQPGGILTQISDNSSDIFTIENSTGAGVIIDGSAKLYVMGEMHILNSALDGIDLQANGSLTIGSNGLLYINGANSSGINGVPGDYFLNEGELYIENIGATGLEVNSFTNKGLISIEDVNTTDAIIKGANGLNEGEIYTDGSFSIQNSLSFTNAASALIRSNGTLSIICDFINQGTLNCRNNLGTGLNLSGNKQLTNEGDIILRPSNTDAMVMTVGYEVFNTKDGVILLSNAAVLTMPGKYIISMDGETTKLTNHGFINLGMLGRREGIKMSTRASIENVGDFYIGDFYAKGLSFAQNGLNSVVLANVDTAYFKIGKGMTANAVALEMNSRVQMTNDPCADFILEDSLALVGTIGASVTNEGYMQLEKFYKYTYASIANSGALYLADSNLALDSPNALINQISNTGLIFHPLQATIVSGVTISPIMRKATYANADLTGGAVFVKNGSGVLTSAGQILTGTNSWTPPLVAAGKDSIFINYRPMGSVCELKQLSIPFITFSACPNPVTLTFTGNISEDWHTAGNWSPTQVPRICDSVIIPNGERCEVASNTTAEAKSILVENGAYFLSAYGSVSSFDPME